MATPDVLDRFGPMARAWFADAFAAPSRVQRDGWPRIADGEHTLMLAPTGSGKTLAAFLWALDHLHRLPAHAPAGVRVLYISPIKALAYDVDRNLRAPLDGMRAVAAARGVSIAPIGIDVRTGDTPQRERRRQLREPGRILITTPESLYLLLGSAARATLAAVDTVIVDEVHALAPSKRGVHLALSLERLSELVRAAGGREPQRIGLSATQRPPEVAARFLGGDRAVAIVDATDRPALDLQVVVPVADMEAPPPPAADGAPASIEGRGTWAAIHPRLLELVRAHTTTIIFVNSRRLAERLSQRLNELAGGALSRAHHGSLSRAQREVAEHELKSGALRAIVATSSLELGIDMGTVDLVIQLESPGAVARGLQRVGRAGHAVGGTSRGRIVPKFRGDLLEAAVVAAGMLAGAVETVQLPENCLDVLAQHLVAMCAVEPWPLERLEAVVRRAASFRSLSRAALVEVLDMLSGRYPAEDFAELRPRLTWDRATDVISARRGAQLIAIVNGGTIPDRGLYAVHLGEGGPRVGELDEEMVHESRPGETFVLGATTWRIEAITRDRVIVSPAPGEPGKMPFWRGEGPGRPLELGRAIGAFTRVLDERLRVTEDDDDPARAATAGGAAASAAPAILGDPATRRWLAEAHCLDDFAIDNLIRFVAAQRSAGALPTDRTIVVERFRDELGDWRVCILTPFGGRVHAPWALLLDARLSARLGYPVNPMWTDDGISLRFADGDALPAAAELMLVAADVTSALVGELAHSPVFASHFRENAARALLLPRRRPGSRTPLWTQRLRAQQLMGVALAYPSFPIVLETYREILKDVFDVPALEELLRGVASGAIRVAEVETASPSPFARGLAFDYVAAYLYEGDAPIAERRAQALALDRTLLRQLLGDDELRRLLDPALAATLEDELQRRAPGRRARHADDLHDLLRSVGDLDLAELEARVTDPVALPGWLAELAAARRAVPIALPGSPPDSAPRWIAVEDAARYRDALGVALPAGLPAVFLAVAEAPLDSLVLRYARSHAPFAAADLARRFALAQAVADTVLRRLEGRGALLSGAFRPVAGLPPAPAALALAAPITDWSDAEVLQQLRRRTLAQLRREVAPVEPARFGRFLPRWHGADLAAPPRRGSAGVREAVRVLEGVALSFAELEARILPARVADYHPSMLDELGARGELVWVGRGALGTSDGRVALYRREHVAMLLAAPAASLPGAGDGALSPPAAAVLAYLTRRGASFLVALEELAPRDQVIAALWELVWAGLVTNDTFAPLRRGKARPRRGGSGGASAGFGGRWSLVAELAAGPVAPTAHAHATAQQLLTRWGIVGPATADELAGGWSSVSGVLRAMEDAGKIRRGYFIDGLGGSQYALPGAVDQLRAEVDDRAALVLAATDPANPWGAVLPWPETSDPTARPQRRHGALVICVAGVPVLHVDPRGKRVITFRAEPASLAVAVEEGLRTVARASRRRMLRIETIDGENASASPLAAALTRAGARADYRGFSLELASP